MKVQANPFSRSLLGSPSDTSDLRKGPGDLKVCSVLSRNQTSPSTDFVTSVGPEASDKVLSVVNVSPQQRQEPTRAGPNSVGPGPNSVGPGPNSVGPGPN